MTCPDCRDAGTIALFTGVRPCPCKTAGIPGRGEAGDPFWRSAPMPVVTLDGVDVTRRCRAYDLAAGTVECFVAEADGRFLELLDRQGRAVKAQRETLHGKVDVRWK